MIAHQLGISVRRVELHRARNLHRLGMCHLADTIELAVSGGAHARYAEWEPVPAA